MTPDRSHAQSYSFFTQPDGGLDYCEIFHLMGLSGFQFPILHMWCSYFYISWKDLKERKKGSSTEIHHTLPPSNFLISFLPAPQLESQNRISNESAKKNTSNHALTV